MADSNVYYKEDAARKSPSDEKQPSLQDVSNDECSGQDMTTLKPQRAGDIDGSKRISLENVIRHKCDLIAQSVLGMTFLKGADDINHSNGKSLEIAREYEVRWSPLEEGKPLYDLYDWEGKYLENVKKHEARWIFPFDLVMYESEVIENVPEPPGGPKAKAAIFPRTRKDAKHPKTELQKVTKPKLRKFTKPNLRKLQKFANLPKPKVPEPKIPKPKLRTS